MENQNLNTQGSPKKEFDLKKEILDWIKTIITAVVLAFIITTFVRPTLVNGVSMFPTLDHNNYLLLYKMAYVGDKIPSRGDIVVFRSHLLTEDGKEKDLVKRVIGVAGDHVIIDSGRVFINGQELYEFYINGDFTDGEVDEIVPEGHVFAMGDNRPNSKDSRHPDVGMVPEEDIVGKVFIRLFPFNQIRAF